MKRLFQLLTTLLFVFVGFSSLACAQAVPEAYKPIIQKYIDGISQTTEYDGSQLGDFGGGMWPKGPGHLGEYGYNLTDINSDGTPELFVGMTNYAIDNAAVYTIENNQYKQLLIKEGSEQQVTATGEIPGYPEESHCIVKSEILYTDDGGNFVGFYKINGSNKAFSVGYLLGDDGVFYRTTDQNNLHQSPGVDTPDTVKNSYLSLEKTPFTQYNPNETAPSQPSQPPVQQGPEGAIYRLYNAATGEHLYTPDFNEATVLSTSHGWTNENIGWIAPTQGEAVYRLYNPVTASHLYTTDTNEVDVLTNERGWQADNNRQPLFYSGGDVPIYRLYNPELRLHHLTKDANENTELGKTGWNQEGQKLSCLS